MEISIRCRSRRMGYCIAHLIFSQGQATFGGGSSVIEGLLRHPEISFSAYRLKAASQASRGGSLTRPPKMHRTFGSPEGKYRFIAYGNVGFLS